MFKKFLIFSYGSWVGAAISLFTTPIVTALILPIEFGKASIYTLAYTIIMQIILLGTDQAFARMFYEKTEQERPNLLWNSLLPITIFALITGIIILSFWQLVSLWLIGTANFVVVVLLCINLLIGCLERFGFMVVRMQQKAHIFSILRITSAIVSFGITAGFALYFKPNFLAIILGNIFALALTFCLLILYEKRFWFSKIEISNKQIEILLRFGLPFVPVGLMSMLFESMDKLFMREYSGFEQLGVYSASFKIVSILTIVQTGFSIFWTPLAYEHYQKKPEDKVFYEDIFKQLSFILFFGAFLLIGLKDVLILLVHQNYRSGSNIVPFLLFIPVMYTITEVTTVGINFYKKTSLYLLIFFIMVLVSILFNYILVPMLGGKGAALSVALSYTVYFSLRTFFSVRLYPMNFNIKKILGLILLFYIVAGINTFINSEMIGVISALTGIIVLVLFNLKLARDLVLKGNYLFMDFYSSNIKFNN